MKSIVISKNEDGIKLLKYLKNIFKDMPDSLLHKLLRKKYFKINDKKADGDEILKTNDMLSIFFADETFDKFYTGNTKFIQINKDIIKDVDIEDYLGKRIIYEDDNIIIYNKPTNLLSQSDKSGDLSVNDILYSYVIKQKNEFVGNYNFRPSIINRLDRNTEGLIIFAKTYLASRLISDMIKNNSIEKHYKTIVNGIVEKDNDILINLYKKDIKNNKAIIKEYSGDYDKDEFSVVKLEYKVLSRNSENSTLDIYLITGKSHQIRSQLSYIGHPIICDKKYMDDKLYSDNVKKYGYKHQKLICYYMKFGDFSNDDFKYLVNKEFVLNVDF